MCYSFVMVITWLQGLKTGLHIFQDTDQITLEKVNWISWLCKWLHGICQSTNDLPNDEHLQIYRLLFCLSLLVKLKRMGCSYCNDSRILRSDRMYSIISQSLKSRDIGYIRKRLSCSRSSCSDASRSEDVKETPV